MRRSHALMFALGLLAAGCASSQPSTSTASAPSAPAPQPAAVPGQVVPPIGLLGKRIGTYVTLTGRAAESGKVGGQTLMVESVDGSPPPTQSCSIWVENAMLPKGRLLTLKGYESGRWIGVPPEVLKATGQPSPQAAWQFQFIFISTSGPTSE